MELLHQRLAVPFMEPQPLFRTQPALARFGTLRDRASDIWQPAETPLATLPGLPRSAPSLQLLLQLQDRLGNFRGT
jgi:hypothetical protein